MLISGIDDAEAAIGRCLLKRRYVLMMQNYSRKLITFISFRFFDFHSPRFSKLNINKGRQAAMVVTILYIKILIRT